jgi:hypothetical protein
MDKDSSLFGLFVSNNEIEVLLILSSICITSKVGKAYITFSDKNIRVGNAFFNLKVFNSRTCPTKWPKPWTNFSEQVETRAEFSNLDMGMCVYHAHLSQQQNSPA